MSITELFHNSFTMSAFATTRAPYKVQHEALHCTTSYSRTLLGLPRTNIMGLGLESAAIVLLLGIGTTDPCEREAVAYLSCLHCILSEVELWAEPRPTSSVSHTRCLQSWTGEEEETTRE